MERSMSGESDRDSVSYISCYHAIVLSSAYCILSHLLLAKGCSSSWDARGGTSGVCFLKTLDTFHSFHFFISLSFHPISNDFTNVLCSVFVVGCFHSDSLFFLMKGFLELFFLIRYPCSGIAIRNAQKMQSNLCAEPLLAGAADSTRRGMTA